MVFIGISVVGVATYLVLLASRAGPTPLAEVDWVYPMLATLGGGMVAGVLGELVTTTLRRGDTAADVRDLEIRRYGMYVGHFFGVVGGVVALGLAMKGVKPFFIAHALYAGFVLSALVGAFVRLRAYRHGLPR